MPELPEVETVCRSLRPHIVNRTIRDVDASVTALRGPVRLQELRVFCAGRTITGVRRRAKFLVVAFDNGSGLILHLGMTGAFRVRPAAEPRDPYARVIWDFTDGSSLRFLDVRRFGSVRMCDSIGDETPAMLDHMGPEPLSPDFDGAYLHRVSRGRSRPIKNLIMDQTFVVGVGNIYANEALFRAGIHPRRNSARISRERYDALAGHIRDVLREAIEMGGTTISDFRGVDGAEGKFRIRLDAYGKAGEPCPRCGLPNRIRRFVLGGRSSFYCPACQH